MYTAAALCIVNCSNSHVLIDLPKEETNYLFLETSFDLGFDVFLETNNIYAIGAEK